MFGNTRFPIFPRAEIRNPVIQILSLAPRPAAPDWEEIYNVRPMPRETPVDRDRYPGTCYRAATWMHVGITQGPGRMDRFNESPTSREDIPLYPLARHWREILHRTEVTLLQRSARLQDANQSFNIRLVVVEMHGQSQTTMPGAGQDPLLL